MKKVVVVVEGKPIVFTGKNLKVSNSSSLANPRNTLYIQERDDKKISETIAVFNTWDYWRELGENENVPFNCRIILKPSKGRGASRETITNIYKQLKNSQVLFIPSTIDVIVLKASGEVKIA